MDMYQWLNFSENIKDPIEYKWLELWKTKWQNLNIYNIPIH